jgi:hypothetical protein
MTDSFSDAKLAHLRRLIVARQTMKFADFGVTEDPDQFTNSLADLFHGMYPSFTVDNLLVRPREALRYCDAARQKTGYFDLPDDIILQAILNRRKRA